MCYFKAHYLLSYTMFISEDKALFLLIFSQEILFGYVQAACLVINLTFCFDLVQTLKNPFETTRIRLWKYIISSLVIPTVLCAFIWALTDQEAPTLYYTMGIIHTEPKLPSRQIYDVILAMLLSIYMLFSFYSIIFAFRRLVRPGVSIEMRKLFLKKHAIYVMVFIIIWTFMLLYNYYELFDPSFTIQQLKVDEEQLKAIQTISYLALFITGFMMGIIRIFDPYYRFLIQQSVMSWFGIIKDEPKEGIMAEVLSSFLSSSLNIELVYIILSGIVRFSKPQRNEFNSAPTFDLEKREEEEP